MPLYLLLIWKVLQPTVQSLTDAITITEQKLKRPKVVLSWAHPRALPHAVANRL